MPDHGYSRYRLFCVAALCALAVSLALTKGLNDAPFPGRGSSSQAPTTTAPVRPAQLTRQAPLAKGKLLVASAALGDPNFIRTVVLLIEYSEKGAMGVILNRATHVKLADLLPRIKSLEERGDAIYEGGPVERSEILMLLRASEEPEDSELVFDKVYLSASADLLKRLATESPRGRASFRVYSGYAGWAGGQLDAEVELGSWHVLPATETAVFAPRPEQLWQELIDRTTLRLALALQRRASAARPSAPRPY